MNYSFKKYHPLELRLWHWLNAIVIFGLLGTVFLRKTFLSWRKNATIIEEKIVAAGGAIDASVSKEAAQALRDNMWEWHYILGFALATLFVARLLIGLANKERFGLDVINDSLHISKLEPQKRLNALHYTAVKIGYAFFYLSLVFMISSGLILYWHESFNLQDSFKELLKEGHETWMWFFVIFFVGHIVGVIIAEFRGNAGIISDMISGGKK